MRSTRPCLCAEVEPGFLLILFLREGGQPGQYRFRNADAGHFVMQVARAARGNQREKSEKHPNSVNPGHFQDAPGVIRGEDRLVMTKRAPSSAFSAGAGAKPLHFAHRQTNKHPSHGQSPKATGYAEGMAASRKVKTPHAFFPHSLRRELPALLICCADYNLPRRSGQPHKKQKRGKVEKYEKI